MDDIDRRVERLDRAVRAGGQRAHDAFREPLDVETKDGPLDAVTAVDRAVQSTVAAELGGPSDAPLVGEEGDARKSVPDEGPAWVVDPIDGTLNYVSGNRTWATSLALVDGGDPVAAANDFPALGDHVRVGATGDVTRNGDPVTTSDGDVLSDLVVAMIYGYGRDHRRAFRDAATTVIDACGDLRRLGSAQATLSMVAAGELDAAVSSVSLLPWDTLAGVHLVRRAGGRVTDLDGNPWRHGADSMVASNGAGAHDDLLDALVDE